jgi:hypothetical protein
MALNWLETERVPGVSRQRINQQDQAVRLARENARLNEENRRLRAMCEDLTASAELWITLYEAALARVEKHG